MFVVLYALFTATSVWVGAYCAIIPLPCFQYRIAYSFFSDFSPELMGMKSSCQLSIVCAVSSRIGPYLAFLWGENLSFLALNIHLTTKIRVITHE